MIIGLRAQAGLLLLRLTPNSLFQEALLGEVADPLLSPEHLHSIGIPLVGGLMQQGERIADRDAQRHLLCGIIQPVGQECCEDLTAALLLALLPCRLALGTARLIEVLELAEEIGLWSH